MPRRGVWVASVVGALALLSPPAVADNSAQQDRSPIVIGLYTPTKNAQFSAPEMIAAARAGVKYVNNELKGINGRKLRLEVCETRNTADTMIACANELAQKEPVAVIGGPDYAGTAALNTVFKPQGIPVVGGISFVPTEFLGPEPVNRSMFLGSSGALFAGATQFAIQELGAKKLADLTTEGPAATAIINAFFNPVMRKNGLPDVGLVQAPPGTADYTPLVEAMLAEDPDALVIQGQPCIAILRAYQATGTDVPLVQPDNCSDEATLKQAGDLAEGMYYVYQAKGPQLNAKDKEVKQYVKATEKYAKGVKLIETEVASSAFSAIMNMRALMLPMQGDITAASLQDALRATVDQPNYLGFGTYSCAEPSSPQFPGICASYARVAQVKDGKLKWVSDVMDTGALLAPE